MAIQCSVAFRNRLLEALLRSAVSTAGNYLAYLTVRSGSAPGVSSAISGTMVGTNLTYGSNLLASSGGVRVLSTDLASSTTTSGSYTPGYARVWDSTGAVGLIEGSVGVTGSGADFILDKASYGTGESVIVKAVSAIKMAANNGTAKMNAALLDALMDTITVNGTSPPTAPFLGNGGTLKIYSGSPPASADDAASGTLLDSITLSSTTWAAPVSGSCALTSALAPTADASGTAGYARITKGAYTLQCAVGISAADIILDTLSLTSGVGYSITDATINLL